MQLYELTIHEAHRLLKGKEISAQELTRAVIDRIDAVDGKVGAYITVARETAMDQAELADEHALAHPQISFAMTSCRISDVPPPIKVNRTSRRWRSTGYSSA